MKIKRHYASPVTQRATVELEGGFCASVMENKVNAVEVTGHTVAEDYDFANPTQDASGNDAFSITWE